MRLLTTPTAYVSTGRMITTIAAAALMGLALTSCSKSSKGDADEQAISEDQILSVLEAVAYDAGDEVLEQAGASAITNPNSALVISRTQHNTSDNPGPDTLSLQNLAQAYMSKSTSSIRKASIEDITGSQSEALDGSRLEGGLQALASDQQANQFALSQGLPAVLAVSIEQFQVKSASAVQGVLLGTARGSVSLMDCIQGTRVSSAAASVSVRGFDSVQVADQLVDQLAAELAAKSDSWSLPENMGDGLASCEVHARVEGMAMPSFKEQGGIYAFVNQGIQLYAPGASVELDGVLVGQTPCRVTVGRGMHTLKVHRPGMVPFEATVNLTGKNRYDAILVPSEETLAKYNAQLVLLRDLKQEEELIDAEIDVLNGYADLLRQSGFRIDIRDIKDSKKLSARPAKSS